MIRREGKCKVDLGEQVPVLRKLPTNEEGSFQQALNVSSVEGVLHHIFVVGVGTFFWYTSQVWVVCKVHVH